MVWPSLAQLHTDTHTACGHLVLGDDPTPQLVMVPEELSGADTILVDCVSDPLENLLQVRDL